MNTHVLSPEQRTITRNFQDQLMRMHAVAEKEGLVSLSAELKNAIDEAQNTINDRHVETADIDKQVSSDFKVTCNLTGYASSVDAFVKMLTSLSKSMALENELPLDSSGRSKFTAFGIDYHGELSLALTPEGMEEINALNDRIGHFMDDDPEMFDEFRAGHLGDTP